MRLVFELLCIYMALVGFVMTAAPTFNLSNEWVKLITFKCFNVSALLFGPIIFTLCLYGFHHFKALSSVCTLRGIKPDSDNFTNIFLLFGSFFLSTTIMHFYVFEWKMQIAAHSLGDENSILNKILVWYFAYTHQERIRR